MTDDPEDSAAAGAGDVTAISIADLAAEMNVTPRRVRQLLEEGRLVKRGRGLVDYGHAVLGLIGERFLGPERKRGVDGNVVVAVGWLCGFRGGFVTGEDLEAYHRLWARCARTEAEAMSFLAVAMSLAGDRAPKFKVGS